MKESLRANGHVILSPLTDSNADTNTHFVLLLDTFLSLREDGWTNNINNRDDQYNEQCPLNS